MMPATLLVGIPLFLEIGFILLIPLVFVVARCSGVSLIRIGIPLLAGLSTVYDLVPLHPGPLLVIGVFSADVDKIILYDLIIAPSIAAIAGPLSGALVPHYIPGTPSAKLVEQIAHEPETQNLSSFGMTLATVLPPTFLILLKTPADIAFPDGHVSRVWMNMVGHLISALLLALLVALYTFSYIHGFGPKKILELLDQSLVPTAAVIMIIGAGGDFKQMLMASGVGDVIDHFAVNAQISSILLAWLVATATCIATGSTTVATVAGAGIVVPVVGLIPDVNCGLLVLITDAGSLVLSHVNDAGFWLVKQYFDMSVSETFKTWTTMGAILSVTDLVFILLLSPAL